ncbi:uncharacterized protein LOC131006211 isoform X2 [Salvia miltiorrhiza]|uniref:uncharacterized protein LOC131006211 isoform X2 n=1 Tax=Salvia miltiorrhiza TaxID=226208 RepID=UPI0025AC64E0|nr:uncharacterized protein LOC131006211 isoform X2 [Salvia miltiorrhiza]
MPPPDDVWSEFAGLVAGCRMCSRAASRLTFENADSAEGMGVSLRMSRRIPSYLGSNPDRNWYNRRFPINFRYLLIPSSQQPRGLGSLRSMEKKKKEGRGCLDGFKRFEKGMER